MKLDKRLLNLVPQCKRWIYRAVACQFLALLASVAAAWATAILLAALYGGGLTPGGVLRPVAVLAAAGCVRAWAGHRAVHYGHLAGVHIKGHLRRLFYAKLVALYARGVPPPETAASVQAAAEGVEQLEVFFGRYVPQFYYSLLAPLTLFAFLACFNLPAALTLLLCMPLIPLAIAGVNLTAKKLFLRYWDEYTDLGGRFLDNLQGMLTLQVFRDDARQAALMAAEAQQFRRTTMRVLVMQLNSVSLMDALAYGGAAAGMAVALWQFRLGQMSLPGVLLVVLLAVEFFLPLRLLGSYFHVAMNGLSASDRIFRVLDMPADGGLAGVLGVSAPLALRVSARAVAYDGGPPVLQYIDLDLPPGSLTVLVGPSGSGKSTLAAVAAGLHPAAPAAVSANGVALARTDRARWHRQVCWVGHSAHVFSGSLRDNLRMAAADADDAALYAALAAVNLDGFVRRNGGLALRLDSGGSRLSGGQRQRLALARAVLQDADVYVLDEALSNVDIDSEERFWACLAAWKAQGKTVLLVTHRLAVARQADRVCVLEGGRLAAQGRHGDLLRQGGLYAAMWQEQQRLEAVFQTEADHV